MIITGAYVTENEMVDFLTVNSMTNWMQELLLVTSYVLNSKFYQ